MTYEKITTRLQTTVNISIKEYFYKNGLNNNTLERIQKIYDKANSDNLKIISSLEDYYVEGRINKDKYMYLMNRKSDITIDLIIFGKILYVSFAVKYITGEISREEYFRIIKEIYPEDFICEREKINNDIKKLINDLENFKKSVKITEKDTCQLCEASESLFNKLKTIENIKLCSECRKYLLDTEKYEGLAGKYFLVNPVMLNLDDISKNIDIDVFINNDALL